MFKKYRNYNNYKSTINSLFAMDDGHFKETLDDIENKNKFQPIKYHPYSVGSANLMLDGEDMINIGQDNKYAATSPENDLKKQLAKIYNMAGETINIYNLSTQLR